MADDLATLVEPDKIVPPATPAVVSQPVQPEDPFAEDDKSGQFVSEQRPSLIERMKSHFNKAVTTETPFGAASHFGDSAIERAARERGQIAEFENDNIDRAIKTREDLAQYDRMPGADGFLEYGAAVIGHLAGNVADPTSAIGNVVKVPYLAGKAFLGVAGRLGVSEGAGLVAGRMAEFGVNQAIINTATDPVVQGLNIASKDGTRTSYDPFQTFVEAPIGGFVGGALLKGAHEAGSALFIKRPVEKQTLDQLVDLRDRGGDAKTADIAAAVQGKSDAELGQMASDIHAAEATPQSVVDRAAETAPADSKTSVEINGERAVSEPVVAAVDYTARSTEQSVRKFRRDDAKSMWAEVDGDIRKLSVSRDPYAGWYPDAGLRTVYADKTGQLYSGGTSRADPLKRLSAEEVASHVKSLDEQRSLTSEVLRKEQDRFTADAEGLASDLTGLGAEVRLVKPDDSSSRYIYAKNGGQEVKIRIADHPQPTDWRLNPETGKEEYGLVGGYSRTEGVRHSPSDISLDPTTNLTREDAVRIAQKKLGLKNPNDAIGDDLAKSYGGENTLAMGAKPSESLAMAVKPQEGSLPRAPEVQQPRSLVTTNMVDAPNLRSMWTDLAGDFGATVRQGRMINKKAAGEFGTSSGVIRMKEIDNLTVLAHEIGHHVEYKYGDPLRKLMDTHIDELGDLTKYASSHKDPTIRRSEGFAEFFRLFAENPTEAANRAPGFYDAFIKFIEADPQAKNALAKVQAQFDAYRYAHAEDIVNANIHTSVEPKGWAKLRADARNNGIVNTIAERGSQVYTGLFDEKNTLQVAVRDLLKVQKKNTGKIITLNAVDDPYKLIRLSSNSHQAGMIDMMHGVTPYRSVTPEGPSLHDAIALASGKPNILSGWDEAAVNKFSGYLIARRAVFEWERRAAGLLDKDPMPFPKDMYARTIEVYERDNPAAKDAADMVHTWTRNLLRKEYEAGLISSDSYDSALKIRDYVPLMRDMSDRQSGGGGGSSFDAGQVGLKKFGGSSRPVVDPLESLMSRSFRTAQLIAHNDAIKALGSLAGKAGVGGGTIAERVPAKELKASYVDPLEAIRKGLIEQGVSSEDAKLAVSSMLDDLQINKQSIGPVSIFRSEQAAARGENLVFYLEGGEMRALRLKEGDFGRELVDTLTGGLSSPLRDWNLQALQKVSNVMRAGITTSPDFFVTNLVRDQMATWLLNRGTLPAVDFMRGIHREVTNSELSRLYAQHGGIAGGANLNAIDHARVDKDIQSLANKGFTVKRLASFEGYFKAVELSETASRLGLFEVAYKRAKKQGLDDYDAAVEAAFTANDNMDFGRHGSRIGDTVKIIPFLNAQLQGLDKAYRTLVAPAFAEKLTTGDIEAQKTMISAYTKIAAVTGLSMALRAAYIDDPEYSELPDYLRNTHWVVRVPGIKGGSVVDALGRKIETPAGLQNLWLAIPKPFELAILPNLGERAVEMLALQDPKALARWAWGAKDLVTAKWMLDSVGVKMAAELTSGKNFFTGREIVPDAIRGREAWAQATSGTSAISKAIGKSVDRAQRAMGGDGGGISPMYIDHIIQGVGGSWGRTFLALSDQAIGTKGDQSLADTAISRRVFKEAYRGSTSVNEFWNQVGRENGQLKQAAATYEAMQSSPADAASYVARLPEDKRAFVILNKSDFPADQKRLHPLYRAELASQAISSMTKQIADRDLTSAASGGKIELSSSEQRVALDSLGRIRMWEARNALIASGAASLKGQKPGNIQAEFDMLKATVPAVYNELAQRYANAKVYKASAVAEHWSDVRKSLIDDGSDAKLGSIARDVSRQGYELDMTREKAKKVRAKIPGVTLQ